jgi:hypothetical protein
MTNCSSPIPIYKYHDLLGEFVLRLLPNFILGALYFHLVGTIGGRNFIVQDPVDSSSMT